MRKTFFIIFAILLPIALFLFIGCQQELSRNPNLDNVTVTKVKTWLDQQKPAKQPNKSANVELLKNNLEFSDARYETLNENNHFLIIPVKGAFKNLKNLDRNTIPELLLTIDKAGNILRGNLVLYVPEAGHAIDQVPANTFSNMYNKSKIYCDGLFKFLSPTGRLSFQYGFKDGKFHTVGEVGEKPKQTPNARTSMCYDTYLHEREWINGVLVSDTWTYLGSWCEPTYTDCDDPNLASICPDGGEGGGGGAVSDCCVADPNAQLISESVSEDYYQNCGSEAIDQTTGLPTKTCTLGWTFNKSSLLFYHWKYVSIEQIVEQKEGNIWKFKSAPTHSGIAVSGSIPPCITSTMTVSSAMPSLSSDRMWAKMDLFTTQTIFIQCIPAVNGGGSISFTDHTWGEWNPA